MRNAGQVLTLGPYCVNVPSGIAPGAHQFDLPAGEVGEDRVEELYRLER